MADEDNKKVYMCTQKVKMFSKFAVHKKFAQIGTSYVVSFSEDELQKTMSANPVLVYHRI